MRGKFDRRVTIEEKTLSQPSGGYGRPIETWITVATRRAARRDLRGAERFAADQVGADVSAVYTLAESVSGLAAEMRIVDESAIVDIVTVLAARRRGGGQTVHVKQTIR
jgi:SPP1 family predicted phage head-tail adaptor